MVATTTNADRASITLAAAQVIPAGTWFVVGAVAQTAGPTVYWEELVGPPLTLGAWGSDVMVGGIPGRTYQSSVTGELPSVYTPAAFGAVQKGSCAWFYRSA